MSDRTATVNIAGEGAIKEEARKTPMRLAIVLFLISESFVFIALFTTYFYLRLYTPVWPPTDVTLDTVLAGTNTGILLISSLTIYLALQSIRRGNKTGLLGGLLATIILGSIFLGITVYEWTILPFQPWSHAYGSIFFTLTGFHALHVFGGILLLVALLIRATRNRFSAERYVAVEVSSYYWHYVNLISILVFISIFIIR